MNSSCEQNITTRRLDSGDYPARKPAENNSVDRELQHTQALMVETLRNLGPGPAQTAALYQVETGGSMLRARLALASGMAFERSSRYQIVCAAACEFIHNASLVHDDLIDRDETRRGRPSVWKKFGENLALCTGDLLVCAAFAVASELDDPHEAQRLTKLLASRSSRIILGQSIEVDGCASDSSPQLRSYLQATTAKTAPLIEMPLLTGVNSTDSDQWVVGKVGELARAIGLAYQIIDDLDDLHDANLDPSRLHVFHACHYHRRGSRNDPAPMKRRATWHADAAMKRARRILDQIDVFTPRALTPVVLPLIRQLEKRNSTHFPTALRNGLAQ